MAAIARGATEPLIIGQKPHPAGRGPASAWGADGVPHRPQRDGQNHLLNPRPASPPAGQGGDWLRTPGAGVMPQLTMRDNLRLGLEARLRTIQLRHPAIHHQMATVVRAAAVGTVDEALPMEVSAGTFLLALF